MALLEIRTKSDWRNIILSGGLLGVIVSVSIFAYNTWYNVPILTYEVLPAYPVTADEKIVAVIVRNEGRAGATDVRIVMQTTGDAAVLPTRLQEDARIASQNSTNVVLTLTRLPSNAQVSLFLKVKTLSESPIADVYVSSLQGVGSKRSPVATHDPLIALVLVARDVFAGIGFVLMVVIIVGTAISSRKKRRQQAKQQAPSLSQMSLWRLMCANVT